MMIDDDDDDDDDTTVKHPFSVHVTSRITCFQFQL